MTEDRGDEHDNLLVSGNDGFGGLLVNTSPSVLFIKLAMSLSSSTRVSGPPNGSLILRGPIRSLYFDFFVYIRVETLTVFLDVLS